MDDIAFYCALALLAGGAVKGVVGVGLPLVAMPLLTFAIDIKSAIALLVVPMIVSNLVQSFEGGMIVALLRRHWPLVVVLAVTLVLSVKALAVFSERTLLAIIGTTVIAFTLVGHFQPTFRIARPRERWAAPLAGAIAGFLGGTTTFFGPPLLIYVGALRLPKDEFVPAISLAFSTGSIALAVGLASYGVAGPAELGLSVVALVPVFAGLWAGQRVRFRLDELWFDRLRLVVYLASGSTFLLRAAGGAA
ncbi:MAG: sulfite exporter TauE/SafE family protein [Pseudomonadota bacterium]